MTRTSLRHIIPILLAICLCLPLSAYGGGRYKLRYRLPARYALLQTPPPGGDVTAAGDSLPLSDSIATENIPRELTHEDSLAIADSLYLDSLRQIFQPLGIWDLDPQVLIDLDTCSQQHYDSLMRFLPDTHDIKKAIRRIAKETRDSIKENTPRVLSTFVIPDSLYYKRILMWRADQRFNNIELEEIDTTYNYHFNDYPFFKNDADATYLGTIGSASQHANFFRREQMDVFPQFAPYLMYSYTPETLPQYNAKTPYTELAYWGTLFATKVMEEGELKLLTTQNITPSFNFTLSYLRNGSRGMLKNEGTDDRSFQVAANYIGEKYLMNAGFINQKVKRTENGGVQETFWIRDTIIDAKAIEVNLASASNLLQRKTWFINQSLAIPMNFLRKNRDSLAVGEGTMAFIGHCSEFTRYTKNYSDKISESDRFGRDFYFNKFYLNNTASQDSIALMQLENKAFIRLQPFAPDAIVSKLDAGIGYQILSYYAFDPTFYYTGNEKSTYHNTYVYAGVSGSFRKYFQWEADGKYTLTGYNMFDFDLGGKVRFSVFPFEKGINLTGEFRTQLKEPDPFTKKINFNHHQWDNSDFSKISDTRIQGTLTIPKWDLEAFFGYALVDKMTYYDTLSVVRQADKPINVMTAYLSKDIRLWFLHLDNTVLFQMSSDEDILPLPKLSLNLKYFVQFDLVKDVMQMQLGLNALFHTAYYVQSYSPDLGVFYNQKKELIGNVPYFDAFVNMQWKRACVFVKYTNCFINWPEQDYFSAYGYIRPQRGFKFGIFWPFYAK